MFGDSGSPSPTRGEFCRDPAKTLYCIGWNPRMPHILKSSAKRSAAFFFFMVCACSGVAQSAPRFDCEPSFPLVQGWLGADIAYSIPLEGRRDLWIFGDTLYGPERKVVDDDPRMVRNSIGISTCQGGKWNIDYTIRRDANGKELDFFQSQHKDTWYWPLDGVLRNDDLWITLLCVRSAPRTTPKDLGFEVCGTDLAHVTGVHQGPRDWKVSYLPLGARNGARKPLGFRGIRSRVPLFIHVGREWKTSRDLDQNSCRGTQQSIA